MQISSFFFLLLFKYSCLHVAPTNLPCPTHPHFPSSILCPFGFVHVPDNLPLPPYYPLPPPVLLLSVCS